jgi:hypothetical protein
MILGVMLCASAIFASPMTAAAQQCQPGIDAAWEAHRPRYDLLWSGLIPSVENLTQALKLVNSQATYATLLASARSVAAGVPNGRLVMTLPDGTVVLDTRRPDGDVPANANSYAHFVAKSINENLNTRVAMSAAQMFPCGIAIETKVSTTTGSLESQFAVRLGPHLDSSGTARLSVTTSPWDY